MAFQGDEPGADDPLLQFEPYVHKAPRRNSITRDKQVKFVMALAATGVVTQAAREVGVSLEALYKLRNKPGAQEFAGAWEAAVDRGMARLEDCALERAILGEERVIVRGGEVVERWRRYDTQLITFLLRYRRQQRFRAPDIVTRAEMEALKRTMFAKWDAEAVTDEKAIHASIDAKLDAMRAKAIAEGRYDPNARDAQDDEDGDWEELDGELEGDLGE